MAELAAATVFSHVPIGAPCAISPDGHEVVVKQEVCMRPFSPFALIAMMALGTAPAYGQGQGPAIHGVTGTIATEATIKDEHKAVNKIAVVTEDGVEHVYDAAKGLVVHGGADPLSGHRGPRWGGSIVRPQGRHDRDHPLLARQ